MICEYEKYIFDLIDGKLNEEKTKRLIEHSSNCIQCSNELKEIENIDILIKKGLNYFPYKSNKSEIMIKITQESKRTIIFSRLYSLRKYAYATAILIFVVVSIHFINPLLQNANSIIKNASNIAMNNTSDKPILDAKTLKLFSITIKDGPPESCKISKQYAINVANNFVNNYKQAKYVTAQYNLYTDTVTGMGAISKDAVDADPILKAKQKIEDIPAWIICYHGISPAPLGPRVIVEPTRFTIVIVDAISGKLLYSVSSSGL